MDLIQLTERLGPDSVEPVYLLHGPEGFLISDFMTRLRYLVLEGPMAEFNLNKLKAPEASGAAIVSEARAVPMMAKRRLVMVEDAHKLKAADLEALDPYVADPVEESVLVLVGEKFDLRRGLFSRANKRGQVHKAEALKERQLVPFVRLRAKVRGVVLGPGADAAIAAAVGSDCAALDDAVERVGLFAGEGARVTEEDVGEVVFAVRHHSVFELVDAIGGRNHRRAISMLEELLSRREEPLRLNALLARHFRQLLAARILVHRRADERAMTTALGVPPFVARKLAGQSRGFRGAQLESAIARLARSDLELKSSRRSGELVLEEAVMDLSFGM